MDIQLDKLNAQLAARIILPKDSEYDEARILYNAMIDKRPAVFVKCKKKHDVAKAIS